MSLTTFFQFTQTSYLPLPPTRIAQSSPIQASASAPSHETSSDILSRGLSTALSMLHSPELMIALNPLVQHYTRLNPFDPENQSQLVNLPQLASEFNVLLATPHSVARWEDSKNGEFVHYEIIDRFNMLFGSVSKLLTYRSCFRPLYEAGTGTSGGNINSSNNNNDNNDNSHNNKSIGTETISDPGNGISLLAKWTLSLDDTRPGFIVLNENVQAHCNILLGWFVRGQLETAHSALHAEFNRRFCRAMIEGDPVRGRDERSGRSWDEVWKAEKTGEAPGRRAKSGERRGDGNGDGDARVDNDGPASIAVSAVGEDDGDISVAAGELTRTKTNDSGVSSLR